MSGILFFIFASCEQLNVFFYHFTLPFPMSTFFFRVYAIPYPFILQSGTLFDAKYIMGYGFVQEFKITHESICNLLYPE